MYRWATKDTHEREDDEAARLVRPSPKVKPPRRDKRRETTRAERDPDTAGDPDLKGDPDRSMNYKTIGGSLRARVMTRYLIAAGRPPPLVPAYDRKTKDEQGNPKKVYIPIERLRNNPSRYQISKPAPGAGAEDEKGKAPGSATESSEPEWIAEEDVHEEPAQAPPDPKRDAAKAKLLETFGGDEKARDAFIEDLPFAERDSNGKLLVFDKKQKKAVPLDHLSPETLASITEKRAVAKLGEDVVAALDKHKDDPKIQAALKDVGFLAGVAKKSGEKEGPLATRLRKLQKEGNPLESLPISKHLPELKDVKLPPEIRSVGDLINATAALREKPQGDAPDEDEDDEKAQAQRVVEKFLGQKGYDTDDFKAYADSLPTTTKGDAGQVLFPKKKSRKRVPFDKLPPDEQGKIIEDFNKKQREKERATAAQDLIQQKPENFGLLNQLRSLEDKEKSAPSDDDPPVLKRIKELQQQGLDLNELPVSKHLPEFAKDLPSSIVSVADLVDVAKAMKVPVVKYPSYSKELTDSNIQRAVKVMDFEQATKLMRFHPVDQAKILDTIEAHLKLDLTGAARAGVFKDLREIYQTDPAKIPPPQKVKVGRGKNAEEVDFNTLSPEEQAAAYQEHKNKVFAISFVADNYIKKTLDNSGAPPKLVQALSKWREPPQPPIQTFATTLTDGGDWLKEANWPPKKLKQVFDNLADEQVVAASAYFQARDYQAFLAKHLKGGQINERMSAREILKKLKAAEEEMGEREKAYPEGTRVGMSKVFRHRVVEDMAELVKQNQMPAEKLEKIREWVREKDADDYDVEHERWEKKVEGMKRDRESRGDSPYRVDELPPEPQKPEGYDQIRGAQKPSGQKSLARSFLDTLKGLLPKRAARVATRYLTCATPGVMPTHDVRQAVYWGVEPYPSGHEGFEPYHEWEQAHARDLGDADHALLLREARRWLDQFVLDPTTMDPEVPDVRFRAALDYAIRTVDDGKYSVGLHPAVYNLLLARLAGQPEGETLLTVRKTANGSSKSLYRRSQERHTMSAAKIRSYAAKLASSNPTIAFDLVKLAQEAEEQQQEQEQEQQGQQQGQQKQAHVALRREVLRVASADPHVRAALRGALTIISRNPLGHEGKKAKTAVKQRKFPMPDLAEAEEKADKARDKYNKLSLEFVAWIQQTVEAHGKIPEDQMSELKAKKKKLEDAQKEVSATIDEYNRILENVMPVD
jgi:hypothetical protein